MKKERLSLSLWVIATVIIALLWTAYVYGSDLRNISGGSTGTGIVETIVPGGNIAVDSTDPANPIVSANTTTTLPYSAITGTPFIPSVLGDLGGTLPYSAITGTPTIPSTFSDLTGSATASQLPAVAQVLNVAISGATYTSVKVSLDSITDSSATKQYVVHVAPGVYSEAPLTIPTYVTLVCDGGYYSTIISTNDNNAHFITMSAASEIQGCAINGPTGTGYAAVDYTVSSYLPAKLVNGVFKDGYYGVWSHAASGKSRIHMLHWGNWSPSSRMENFARATDYGNVTVMDSAAMSGSAGRIGIGFYADGANASITVDNSSFRNSGGTGFEAKNGAIIRAKSATVSEAAIASSVSNTSYIHFTGSEFDNTVTTHFLVNDADAHIAFGGGVANKARISNPGLGKLPVNFVDETLGEGGTYVSGEIWNSDLTGDPNTTIPLRDYGISTYSTGWLSGGVISKSVTTALYVDVTAGTGYSNTGTAVKKVIWNATAVPLTDNTPLQYIYSTISGTITVSTVEPDKTTTIMIGVADASNNAISFFAENVIPISNHIPDMNHYLETVVGPISTGGGIATKNAGDAKKIDVTAGTYHRNWKNESIIGGTPVSFHTVYRDGSGGWNHTSGVTSVPNDKYDDGSGVLQNIPSGYYVKHVVYFSNVTNDEYYHLIYSQATYSTQVLAEAAGVPVVSEAHQKYAMRLFSTVISQGSNTIDVVKDERPFLGQNASQTASVTAYNQLSGLPTINGQTLVTEITITTGSIGAAPDSVVTSLATHTGQTGTSVHGLGTMSTETAANYSTTTQANGLYISQASFTARVVSQGTTSNWQSESQVRSLVTSSISTHNASTGVHGAGANSFIYSNDARLTDARTPTAHSQAFSTITGSVPLASAVSGSLPWVNISTSYPTFNQNTSGTAAGLSTILALASGGTNSTLSGCAGNDFVRMNAGKTALECAAIAGGGDMLKADNLSGLANYTTARNNLIGTTAGNALEIVRVNAGATDFEIVPAPVSAATLTCGTTDKFSAYNATSGVFTCTADSAGGGGGTPGGADTQIQFNDGGAFGGDAGLTWNKSTSILSLTSGTNPGVTLGDVSTDLSAPSAGTLSIYAKSIANRLMPKWIGPSGVDTPFQAFLGFNGVRQVSPGTGTTAATAMTAFGTSFTSTGTQAQVAMTTGTAVKNKMRMVGMSTSTTAGNLVGNITPNYEAKRNGGYFFTVRFGTGGTIQSGQRQFHGLWAATTIAANNDPTTSTTAKVGIGYALSGTTGNWKIVMASGSAAMTAIDLGATHFAVSNTGVYELVLFAAPAGNTWYRVTNLEDGFTQTGELTSNPPASSTLLAVQNWVTNNATAAASQLLLNKWYLETDY